MRKGGWMQTFTGKKFWHFDPQSEEISIKDIAHSLANQCRFNGHCQKFYSVAQHSVIVSKLVQENQALPALLHDAPESYIGDIVSPLKKFLPKEFKEIENSIEEAIFNHFGIKLEEVDHKDIKNADNIALVTEFRDLWDEKIEKNISNNLAKPHSEKIIPLNPEESEKLFLERFNELTQE